MNPDDAPFPMHATVTIDPLGTAVTAALPGLDPGSACVLEVQAIRGALLAALPGGSLTEEIPWDLVGAVRWHPLNHLPDALVDDLGLDAEAFRPAELTFTPCAPAATGLVQGAAYDVQPKDGWLYVRARGMLALPPHRVARLLPTR